MPALCSIVSCHLLDRGAPTDKNGDNPSAPSLLVLTPTLATKRACRASADRRSLVALRQGLDHLSAPEQPMFGDSFPVYRDRPIGFAFTAGRQLFARRSLPSDAGRGRGS